MAQFKKEKLNMLQFKLAQLNMAQFNWKKTKYGTVQGSKLAKCFTVIISKLAKYRKDSNKQSIKICHSSRK